MYNILYIYNIYKYDKVRQSDLECIRCPSNLVNINKMTDDRCVMEGE